MKLAYWISVMAAAGFIGWSHDHTDEIPVVLGFVLILSTVVCLVFPKRPWLSGFLLGAPVFLVETLVHFGLIGAPYPASPGLPWPALTAFVPSMGGAFFGSAVRHLSRESNPAR